MLYESLGLGPKTRVFLQEPTQDEPVYLVWDLETGTTNTITFTTPAVTKGYREVPANTREIIAATTEDLQKRWLSTNGWDDDRSSIFSELTIRGVRILDLPTRALHSTDFHS